MKTFAKILLLTVFTLASPAQALAATLSLSPSSGTFNRGCDFTLDVMLDTQGAQTDGTDAIILFDSARFTANQIFEGAIYPDYPGNNIEQASGKITVSGLASVTQAFTGTGTLARVSFTVKENAPTGTSQVRFDFDPNDKTKTTDSNVVERETVNDVLSSVVNGSYTIGTGSCTTQTPTAPAGPAGTTFIQTDATPSGVFKDLDQAVGGKTGSEQLTFTLAIVGTVLTILGILGLALL